ncbi:MAG: N-acetyltransferase, partial [Ruminococcaceae bacterium]|nr:N-acetyltransferase [Oscillospiraceae bacterium]
MNWIYEEGRIYCEDENKKLMAEAILIVKTNGELDIEHVFVDSSL